MASPSSKTRKPPSMSLESSLAEENRQVLARLNDKNSKSPRLKPAQAGLSPPPVRSMLDVGGAGPRRSSGAGLAAETPKVRKGSKPMVLDPSDPSTWTRAHTVQPKPKTEERERSMSEDKGYVGLPRIQADEDRGFEQNYNFDMSSIPSTGGGAVKSSHVGQQSSTSARHNSTSAGGNHSRSPSSRTSPTVDSTGHLSPVSPKKPVIGTGNADEDKTNRRLSNKSSSFSTVTDDSEADNGRITKDKEGDEDALAESSDEERRSSDSDADGESRGRDRARKQKEDTKEPARPAEESLNPAGETGQERTAVSHSQLVKSMLEPAIHVTSPDGEKTAEKPSTANELPIPKKKGPSSNAGSGDEDEEDAIAKAKTLGLLISPLDTKVVNRHVRMIIRGNWAGIHAEAEKGHRNIRTYLTCTDLSIESMYALEWTVGTIMRDGDTLLAIYAIEDETSGTETPKLTEAEKEELHVEGAQAGKEATEVMEKLTRQTTQGETIGPAEKYVPATEAQSLTGSVDSRKVGKKEMERLKAIEDVTQAFLKLVRKTTLQVRCMVEVIHCKSPKHLILGAIDELDPTLTIVGTRGRSSLKGVLLGSFSNYLVTKSSAPVMVARKRLKKPRSQIRVSSNKIRLSNNLMASAMPGKRKSLTQARID